MSTLPYESTVFVGKGVYTHYFSPDETAAQQIAHWHLSKGATQVVVLERATRERRTYEKQGDTILSPETGEEIFEHPGIQELTLVNASLEKALRAERLAHAKTRGEKEDEMEASPEHEDIALLFEFWKRICKHPRAVLDLTRFRNVLPFYRKEGMEMCAMAIAGKRYEIENPPPFKKGAEKIYDDWELIFRDRAHSEKYCNIVAKIDWKELYGFN